MKYVSVRNAAFQRWQTLLTNRSKRNRAGELVVQGVRPISQAVEHGWQVRAWLVNSEGRRSGWATDLVGTVPAQQYSVTPELMAELGEKEDDPPELLALVAMAPDDISRIPVAVDFLGIMLDRPSSPGNLGAVLRSADAFGASGVLVSGHAADPYDPRAVRASTGSVFAVPAVRTGGPEPVLEWVSRQRAAGVPIQLVATDEDGEVELPDVDLTGPTLVLTGNETRGLSRAWRDAADLTVRIPMAGAASSLNAASATTVVLYERLRQRRSRP